MVFILLHISKYVNKKTSSGPVMPARPFVRLYITFCIKFGGMMPYDPVTLQF